MKELCACIQCGGRYFYSSWKKKRTGGGREKKRAGVEGNTIHPFYYTRQASSCGPDPGRDRSAAMGKVGIQIVTQYLFH